MGVNFNNLCFVGSSKRATTVWRRDAQPDVLPEEISSEAWHLSTAYLVYRDVGVSVVSITLHSMI